MSNTNSVTIAGNVTRDTELKFLVNGAATIQVTVAVNRRWHNPTTGQWDETTSYFDVVCWGDLAAHVAQSAGRGTRVVVTGRLEQRNWESKGQKRSKVELVAEDVALSLRFATGAVTQAAETAQHADANPVA